MRAARDAVTGVCIGGSFGLGVWFGLWLVCALAFLLGIAAVAVLGEQEWKDELDRLAGATDNAAKTNR